MGVGLVLEVPERSHEDHEHLGIEVGDVFPDQENHCAEFAGNRDCVFRVEFLFFWCRSWVNQVPVDYARFDGSTQFDQIPAVLEIGVLKSLDGSFRAHFVDPGHKVLLSLRTKQLKIVTPHQLPHNCQHTLLVSLSNVLRT